MLSCSPPVNKWFSYGNTDLAPKDRTTAVRFTGETRILRLRVEGDDLVSETTGYDRENRVEGVRSDSYGTVWLIGPIRQLVA